MNWRLSLHVIIYIGMFSGTILWGAEPQLQKNEKNSSESTQEVVEDEQESGEETDSEAEEKKEDEKESPYPKKEYFKCAPGDSEFKFGVKLRLPEFFYGKNLRLLNNNNPTDRVLYFRHTLDFNLEYRYGQPKVPYDIVYAKMTIRNKGVWGDPESIASTTLSPIRELGTSFGDHIHGIPRHILWVRELWVQFSLNDLLCLPFCNNHTVTFGSFPFELGRGIALGAAYAVDATDLGFISEYAIDQYAFGGKLSGELLKDRLFYDLYGAILDNRSATFSLTNAKIRGQQYFHRDDQARGFGIINYVVAARVKWHPTMRFDNSSMRVEPYILYNHNPEQRVEFRADAKSDLVTLGIACESEFGDFEWGFDTAYNFGNQTVFGWDRNIVKLQNSGGTVKVVNSQVRQTPGEEPDLRSPLAVAVSENQAIINQSPQTQLQNSTQDDIKVIGMNNLGPLINSRDRFSDRFVNKFRGAMFVFDMCYHICKPDLKVCAGFGYASGDANPNRDEEFPGDSIKDEVYEGFIGLQEVYSGTRVRSAFLLSGQGRIPRPLSFPNEQVSNPFSTTVSRFTNLLYTGASAYWDTSSWCSHKWSFNPNILAYWNDFATPFFDARTVQNSTSRFAREYLGFELNLFFEAELLPDLRLYSVSAIFLPGSHYKDIKGRPLNRAQQAFLDNLDKTGIINDRVPLLGDDTSYFVNVGLEYRF